MGYRVDWLKKVKGIAGISRALVIHYPYAPNFLIFYVFLKINLVHVPGAFHGLLVIIYPGYREEDYDGAWPNGDRSVGWDENQTWAASKEVSAEVMHPIHFNDVRSRFRWDHWMVICVPLVTQHEPYSRCVTTLEHTQAFQVDKRKLPAKFLSSMLFPRREESDVYIVHYILEFSGLYMWSTLTQVWNHLTYFLASYFWASWNW